MPSAIELLEKSDVRELVKLGFMTRLTTAGKASRMQWSEVDERVRLMMVEKAVVSTEEEAKSKGLYLGEIAEYLLDGSELSDDGLAAFEALIASRLSAEPHSSGVQGSLADTEFFLIVRGPVKRPHGSEKKVWSISTERALTSEIMAITAGDGFLRAQKSMLKQAKAIAARHPDQEALAFAAMIEQAQRSLANARHQVFAELVERYDGDPAKIEAAWSAVEAAAGDAEQRVAITPTRVNETGAGARLSLDPQLAIAS